MHSLLDVPQPKVARLKYGLSASERRARWKQWKKAGYDGIEINIVGEAFGPTWPKGTHTLDFLADFPGLKALVVNVKSLESLEPLSLVADSLQVLQISMPEPSKLSCGPIASCRKLRRLGISRLPKDLEAIETLTGLEELTLWGLALKSLEVVRPLKNLETLYIGFSSLPHIAAVGKLSKLKALDMLMVRKLDDLSPLSQLKTLQYLALANMKQVAALPDCSSLKALRRVYLDTMNGVTDLGGLARAPRLEDLIVTRSKIEASVFDPIVAAPRPKRVTVGLASRKAKAAVETALGKRAVNLFGSDDEMFRLK